MRRLYWLSMFLATSAACLALVAAYHYSFLRDTAKDSVEFIERQFIDGAHLDREQQQQLKRAKQRINGGEKYLRNLLSRLWWIFVFGFGVCSVCFSLIAVLVRKIEKSKLAESDARQP